MLIIISTITPDKFVSLFFSLFLTFTTPCPKFMANLAAQNPSDYEGGGVGGGVELFSIMGDCAAPEISIFALSE